MSNDEQTTDICGTSLGVGWWCVKPSGHAPPCCDAVHAVEIAYRRRDTARETLEAEVVAMRAELEALRAMENAALAYMPSDPWSRSEPLILALANVEKVRGDAAKGKGGDNMKCKHCGHEVTAAACPVRVERAAKDPRQHNAVWGMFGTGRPAADVLLCHEAGPVAREMKDST